MLRLLEKWDYPSANNFSVKEGREFRLQNFEGKRRFLLSSFEHFIASSLQSCIFMKMWNAESYLKIRLHFDKCFFCFSLSLTTLVVVEWVWSQRRGTRQSPRWWWRWHVSRTRASTRVTPAWAAWPMSQYTS